MAAPASAAPRAASAISWGDAGRYFDIDGVWMAPVTALVMITLRACDMRHFLLVDGEVFRPGPVTSAGPAPAAAWSVSPRGPERRRRCWRRPGRGGGRR